MRDYYVNPISLEYPGFYFYSYEEYEKKTRGDDVIIQYTGVDPAISRIWYSADIKPENLKLWFDADVESMCVEQQAALYYLIKYSGHTLESALPLIENVILCKGDKESYAEGYLEEIGFFDGCQNLELLKKYFDYEAFSRDFVLGGEIFEFWFSGSYYTIVNASEIEK